MRYALLIYTPIDAYEGLSDEERRAISDEAWALREDPRVIGGERLHPIEVATTVRVKNGQTLITDGPFADTKEVFGGFYLVEAQQLDDAIELAARIPTVHALGGSVEIRPVVDRQT